MKKKPTNKDLDKIEAGEEIEEFEIASKKDLEYLERLVFGDVPVEEMLKR